MPARKRHRHQPAPTDPIVRFGRGLIEQAEKEKAAQERLHADRAEAKRQEQLAAERAAAIAAATARVEQAIASAKRARASGRGIAEADAEWKAAKAALIELETGEAPGWI